MEFLNFIINLPNKCEEVVEVEGAKEEKSIADCFYEDMETFFKGIEDREEVRMMKIFNKNDP